MPAPFVRDRFTWLAYLLISFYGYFLNILGPITPFLKDELKLSYTISSLHFTAFAIGILLIGLFGGSLIKQIGRWRSLWVGAFGMSLSALLLISGLPTPIVTIGASFLMGLVGSLILAIVPSALADQHGESRAVALSEANVVASLVSMMAPLLVGGLAGTIGGWRSALVIGALLPLGMWFAFRGSSVPVATRSEQSTGASQGALPVLYWIYWGAIMLAVAVEFCMIFWSADYLERVLGMGKANAAQAVSLFLIGMIVGRLAGSRLVQRFATRSVVFVSLGIAGAGFAIYWLAGSIWVVLAGLFLTGLGVASLYPLILSLAMGVSNGQTVQAGARATLASGVAILALPLILGRVADAVGIWLAYGVVVALLVIMLAVVTSARVGQTDFLNRAD